MDKYIYINKNTVMHNFLYPRKQTIGSTMVNLALARSSDAAHQVRPPEGWNDHDLRREATWEKGGKRRKKHGEVGFLSGISGVNPLIIGVN
jgi:hypothetical protein